MTCTGMKELFSAEYDGRITPEESVLLARHLEGCSGCRSERAELCELLGGLGPALHRAVASEDPRGPLPAAAPGRWWLSLPRWAALGATAAASFLLAAYLGRGVARNEVPALPVRAALGEGAAADCPWRRTQLAELEAAVSYPVFAQECLEAGFELVEARVREGHACTEQVRLTYRAGGRSMTLHQHLDATPGGCPGDHVVVGEVTGCLKSLQRGVSSLSFWLDNRSFRLEGELGPAEAVAMARTIAETAR